MRALATLAKYPFLHDTRQFIKDNGPSVDELLNAAPYERARIISIERLDNAFKNRDVGQRSLASQSNCIMEILSYPLARMVTVCIGDSFFKKRYALGEAYHMYKHLLNESTSFLLTVAKELDVNVQYNSETNTIKIFFKDYLRNAPTRYKEWKMINRGINSGFLAISHKDLARILLESLRERINKELLERECDKSVSDTFSSDIQRYQNMLAMQKKKIEAAPVGKVSIEKLPPCMKDILSAIQSGENVPHMGRFALVAFLSSLKLNTNEILKLFSTAPDYQEDRTRYQVEHITGTSSSTEYKCPGCEKMRTYGICPVDKMDEFCKKIRHPLSYYSNKWKQEKQKS
ncbi:MAG TPA: DNA primase large subunit PriL [Candidatus Thermoplasmatota archaeon]|nr:DNA primase large subunit PriL [Candidatus Thermoplasmatota archaeon]